MIAVVGVFVILKEGEEQEEQEERSWEGEGRTWFLGEKGRKAGKGRFLGKKGFEKRAGF